jgi:CheY-like chemotaxis protein
MGTPIAEDGRRGIGLEASGDARWAFLLSRTKETGLAAAYATVLAVEDDPIVRRDLRLVLEDAGFEVSDAKDGVQAVELARKHEPDAIVLDLGLPRLGGVEATRRILAERDVPIVALTGRSQGLAEEAIEAGASSYVLKPFEPEEVVGAVLDAIALRADPLRAAREESRRTIAQILGQLGYAEEWAVELEEQAFASGKLWRETTSQWRSV